MTTGDRKYPVGFIGIGKMGFPMACRIVAHGYPLFVYDLSVTAIEAFCGRGAVAQAAKTLADIGRSSEVVADKP